MVINATDFVVRNARMFVTGLTVHAVTALPVGKEASVCKVR
jgi:hypothetical protein